MNEKQPKLMSHPQKMMQQAPLINPTLMNPVQQHMMSQMSTPGQLPVGLNPTQSTIFIPSRSYQPWPPQQQQLQNPKNKKFNNKNPNWKGKKTQIPYNSIATTSYNPPSLSDLQSQNRMKARKFFYPKKKFNNNNRFAPYAPRNTSSFIIRAKKAGGIADLVSPGPVTPAVLPTPIFSPSRETLGDMAKEEWGVDGYGSMKGLIRLRSPAEGDDEDGNESSESDVEEHVEVERRLDHDLSRFEMIYPTGDCGGYSNVLEHRVDDQDSHIAQLEEENLTLKERLFLMERELADLRRRMQFLERQQLGGSRVDGNEEVVENGSENESDGGSDVRGTSNGFENDVDDDNTKCVDKTDPAPE